MKCINITYYQIPYINNNLLFYIIILLLIYYLYINYLHISVSTLGTMEFLDFSAISFGSDSDMGLVCKNLNSIFRAGVSFDTFTVQNKKW